MHLFMWCHVVLFFTAENMKIINGEDIFLGPLWISGLSRQSWRNTVYRIFFLLLSSGSHEPATGKLKESFPR